MIKMPILDPMTIVRQLTQLEHRGATTPNERRAAEMLRGELTRLGASVELETFRSPRSYLWPTWWLLGGLIVGLLLVSVAPLAGLALAALAAAWTWHYFDWRASPIIRFPMQGDSQNVIAHDPRQDSATPRAHRLILMAHYDSAPISLLYSPTMVKSFRQSLRTSLIIAALAVLVALLDVLGIGEPYIARARLALAAYFVIQGLVATIDHVRLGHSNGAADNASGVGAAVATAARLWGDPLTGWQVDVVLTGAEEANLVGSHAYHVAQREAMDPQHTFVLNFNNLGAGKIKVIIATGSITSVAYRNELVEAALHVAASDARFTDIEPAEWHTGDFDTIWFARGGIPSLTLSSQDDQGLVPHLHRPSDTIENMDPAVVHQAVEFDALIRHLTKRHHWRSSTQLGTTTLTITHPKPRKELDHVPSSETPKAAGDHPAGSRHSQPAPSTGATRRPFGSTDHTTSSAPSATRDRIPHARHGPHSPTRGSTCGRSRCGPAFPFRLARPGKGDAGQEPINVRLVLCVCGHCRI